MKLKIISQKYKNALESQKSDESGKMGKNENEAGMLSIQFHPQRNKWSTFMHW